MTNAQTTHTGGCQCGAVRFTAIGQPLLVANCHCNSCRKATGAAFATFVDFNRREVAFEQAVNTYRSSRGAERLYCNKCGTPIAYRGDGSPKEINIYIGAFDHPECFEPTENCHYESALWRIE